MKGRNAGDDVGKRRDLGGAAGKPDAVAGSVVAGVPDERQNYLRFHDPARPGSAIGYLWPTFFSFTRDRERLKGVGRIVPSTGEVAFDYGHATRGLEIAQMLKG